MNITKLVAHGERKKAAYLVLSTITQEIELIPSHDIQMNHRAMNQCKKTWKAYNPCEIMKGGKLSKQQWNSSRDTSLAFQPACSRPTERFRDN